jgi:hypothetical protein
MTNIFTRRGKDTHMAIDLTGAGEVLAKPQLKAEPPFGDGVVDTKVAVTP